MPRAAGRRYLQRVLGLFLAASLVPVIVLSITLTGIAATALARASAERGEEAAHAFAARFDALLEGVSRSLALVCQAPEIRAALDATTRVPGEYAAAISRSRAREAARGSGHGLARVDTGGTRVFATRPVPEDWDLSAYGFWGIFRRARDEDGAAVIARRRIAANGEIAIIVIARAIRASDGSLVGFALAEIDRSLLVRIAREGWLQGGADFELISPSSLVAFSLAEPSREGLFLDELSGRGGDAGEEYEAPTRTGFRVRAYMPSALLAELTRTMRRATFGGLAAGAVLALALALAASRAVTGPVIELSEAMRRLRAGDLSARLEPVGDDELADLMRSFNATSEELARLIRVEREDQELLRGAELRALAARMNPHFLYNSLNSIRSLAKLGRNAEIVEVVARLGKLLRASAGSRDSTSTADEELALVRHYLAVERIRFGERFTIVERIDPEIGSCELPSLVLEPLAENAFSHGLERKSGSGSLVIEALRKGNDALFAFEDDGPGAPPEKIAELVSRLSRCDVPTEGSGLGLAATNRRVRLRYGEPYGISASSGRSGSGFRVELRVPFRST